MLGTSLASMPVSEIRITSACSFSLLARTKISRLLEPISSSPSNMNLMLQGTPPWPSRIIISKALTCMYTWPLSSQAPRAYIFSSLITGSKGGEVHSS